MLEEQIVEEGAHVELMHRDSIYAWLIGIQNLERTLGLSLTT